MGSGERLLILLSCSGKHIISFLSCQGEADSEEWQCWDDGHCTPRERGHNDTSSCEAERARNGKQRHVSVGDAESEPLTVIVGKAALEVCDCTSALHCKRIMRF